MNNFKSRLKPSIPGLKQVPIHINYPHMFNLEMKIDCKKGHMKISGLHHDHNGAIAKSGILDINFSKHLPGGAYEIEIGYGLTQKPSGMFPQDWNHAKVVEKALEAYGNPIIQFPSENGGRYLVYGQTKEGMNVLWVFETINEQPTGNVISIYPVEEIPKNKVL